MSRTQRKPSTHHPRQPPLEPRALAPATEQAATVLAQVAPEDLPLIENEPSLEEWLDQHGAEKVWELPAGAINGVPAFAVSLWRFRNGRTAIVQVGSHGQGWEIYPALGATDIDDALTAAEDGLGLADVG